MKMKSVEKILEGDVQAAAKLMRGIEEEQPDAFEELGYVYSHCGGY